MRSRWRALLALAFLAACAGEPEADRSDARTADAAGPPGGEPGLHDPCALVSAEEMERFLGPLAEPPYRVESRRAAPDGQGCFYRAADGRNVTLEVDWEEGPLAFRMMAGTGGQVEDLLGGRDMSADTLEVPWDDVALSFGQLIALKDDVSIQIDPLGSRLDVGQSAELVGLALGRLDDPLPYDGSWAARGREAVRPREGDPCSLLTRAEVEEAMGPLRTDPYPSEDGGACVFPVDRDFFGTPMERQLEVRWSDGFYTLGQERQALGMAGNAMGAVLGEEDMPELGTSGSDEGPWDERVTLLGGVVTVVRKDVLLKLAGDGAFGFGEDEALGLLRRAVERIR